MKLTLHKSTLMLLALFLINACAAQNYRIVSDEPLHCTDFISYFRFLPSDTNITEINWFYDEIASKRYSNIFEGITRFKSTGKHYVSVRYYNKKYDYWAYIKDSVYVNAGSDPFFESPDTVEVGETFAIYPRKKLGFSLKVLNAVVPANNINIPVSGYVLLKGISKSECADYWSDTFKKYIYVKPACEKASVSFSYPKEIFANTTVKINNNSFSSCDVDEFLWWLENAEGKIIFTDSTNYNAINYNFINSGNYKINLWLKTGGGNTLRSQSIEVLPSLRMHINETSKLKFNLYPNPTTGIVNFGSEAKIITVKNISGESIKVLKNTAKIDIETLAAGVYILDILTPNNERIIRKIHKL